MDDINKLPLKLMVLIALVQGFCLLYLHQSISLDYWPNQQPQWLFAFYSVAFSLPVMLLLSLDSGNMRSVFFYSIPFALLSSALGFYIGSQTVPLEHIRFEGLLFAFVLTMLVATFKALMYIQQIAAGEKINYTGLFRWSWRNFLTLALSLIFAGAFCLILVLWAALFSAIGIDLFKNLFETPWFYYPAIALANGFGVIIFRRLTSIIDTITRLQQALMKFLLIVLVLVSILFLCALPFTGLPPLWESGGSALILWMQALILFFVNGVYQDDPEQRPYILSLHRFVYFGVALLPIYSAISFYGLSLRVDQYGWSLMRCWAFLIWFLLALFPLGYWWGIAKQKDDWTFQLSRVNVAIGLVVLAAALLVNSPFLDFRKVVVGDQIERLQNNDIDADKFDINYFKRHLAKPGYEALQNVKVDYAETNPELVLRINQLYRNRKSNEPAATQAEFIAALTILPDEVPELLLESIYKLESKNRWQVQNTLKYYLQVFDLNDDSQMEYLLVSERHKYFYLSLYYLENGQWYKKQIDSSGSFDNETRASFIEALKFGTIKIEQPKWNDFVIDGKEFRVDVDR